MKLGQLFPDDLQQEKASKAKSKGKASSSSEDSASARIFINALQPGQKIDAFWLVTDASLRAAKNGSKYINATFGDKTGTIPVRQWDASEDDFSLYSAGGYIRALGTVDTYREKLQMVVSRVQSATEKDVNPGDFLPVSKRNQEEMENELRDLIASFTDEDYKALLRSILNDSETREKFVTSPAASAIHHAWRGGLLEHVLSTAKSADQIANDRPYLNRDLLVAGVILHDIGKIEELDAGPGFAYTDIGRLCGHIALGALLIDRHIAALENFPAPKRNLILHLILSHHGTREHGSPVTPAIPEAIVLHHIECLDAKVQGYQTAVEDELETGKTEGWTDFKRVADGRIYLGEDQK